MFLKYSCQKPKKNFFRRLVFLEKLHAARNFSKFSLHFNKIPNPLRQIFHTYSEICIFLCYKKVLQKQSAKIDLKVPGKSCDEIDDDVMKFI